MNVGHFGYLLDGNQPQQTKLAADRLETLAKIAAKRYLEEQQPLTATITKLAKENDLNNHQIDRVCEMANIATHRGLWTKTAQKEKIAFPIADPKAVKLACGCDSPPPCGDMDADYLGPPKGLPTAGPDLASAMGVDVGGGHNGLSEEPEKKRIIIVLQKKAAEAKALRSKLLVAGMQCESLEKQAFAAVKQAVLGGETFRRLYAGAAIAGLGKIASELFPKFEEQLIKDTHGDVHRRLVKQAISQAPADLISDNLGNTTVINGAHPVLVSLDCVQRKTGEIEGFQVGLVRMNDEIKMFQQKIRELS